MGTSKLLKNKAIFLDRDGTINEEMGYINHIERFKMFDFVPESIRIFRRLGYKIIIVTNQSGIARGYFTENLLSEVHRKLIDQLKKFGAMVDDIYYCPHHPTEGKQPYRQNCDCRKPKPGMILKAKKDWDLDLSQCLLVGDRYKDIRFAKNLGIGSAMVLTGYGMGEYTYQRDNWESEPDIIGENLLDVAKKLHQLSDNKTRVDKKG
jgi:D-glycero-D-manno-heptose 1,7-bisphosphate phosphatase